MTRVASFVDVTVGGDESDAEPCRIGLPEFGDVVGDGTVVEVLILGAELLEVLDDRAGNRRE